MRILFLTRKFPPSVGGMQTFSFKLYENLKKGNQVFLIALGGSQIWLPLFLPYLFIKSLVLIQSRKPEVIYLSDGLLSPIGLLLKLLFNKPAIITIHGKDITYSNTLYKIVIPFCVSRLDKIICVSRATLSECTKRNIPKEKCQFIPNAIDPKNYETSLTKPAIRKKLSKIFNIDPENKLVILTLGRLILRKGHLHFIRNVIRNLPENTLYLIAGQGPEKEKIELEIKKQQVERQVFLLGEVSENQKRLLLSGCDLMAMPNIKVKNDIEGFGITAIEAGVCGLPVLASNIEGLNDAVTNDKNGYLLSNWTEFVNKIKLLTEQKKELNKLSQTSVAFCRKNFSWEKIIEKYEKIFSKFTQPIVTFSFDDCYQETVQTSLPILKKFGFKATYNAIADTRKNEFEGRKLATLQDLKVLQNEGMEIASHSLTHNPWENKKRLRKYSRSFFQKENKIEYIKKGLKSLIKKRGGNFVNLKKEIVDSKKILQQKGFHISSFVYPGGVYDKNIKKQVALHYSSARSSDAGLNDFSVKDLFALKVFAWDKRTTANEVNKWLDKAIESRKWLIESFHLLSHKKSDNYEYHTQVSEFEKHLKYLKTKRVKIATQKEVVKYITDQNL